MKKTLAGYIVILSHSPFFLLLEMEKFTYFLDLSKNVLLIKYDCKVAFALEFLLAISVQNSQSPFQHSSHVLGFLNFQAHY